MWTMAGIMAANKAAGQKFFDPEAIRFFRSRVLPDVYEGPGGVYFVTSEADSSGKRRYTVRSFDPATGDVATVGNFYEIDSLSEAKRKARICAQYSRDIERRLAGGAAVEIVPGFTIQKV